MTSPRSIDPPRPILDDSDFLRAAVAACLLALSAAATLSAEEIAVQVTSFQVPELAVGLESLGLPPEQDAAFYERLVRLAGAGEAQIVLDHRLTTKSGARTKSEAVAEFVHPTEFEPVANLFLHVPTAFDTRNLGTMVEIEPTIGDDNPGSPGWQDHRVRFIDLTVSPKRVRLKGLLPLGIPNVEGAGSAAGRLNQPVLLSETILASVSLSGGQPVLLGLTRPADQFDERPGGATQQVILTFVRASTEPAEAALAAPGTTHVADAGISPPPPVRLHEVGLRVPRLAAAQALWQHGGGDAGPLLAHWLKLAQDGRASVLSHAAVATRTGLRAKIEGVTEIIHTTEIEPPVWPTAFDTRNVGTTWEVEPILNPDSITLDVTASVDDTGLPVWKSMPIGKGASAPSLEFPDFLNFSCRTAFTLPPGETRLMGAVTPVSEMSSTGVTEEALDVTFLKSAPAPRHLRPGARNDPRSENHLAIAIAVFSVDDGQAQALKAVIESETDPSELVAQAVDELWEAAAAGDVSLAAFASMGQRQGHSSRVQAIREWITATEWSPQPDRRDILAPTAFDTLPIGTRLVAQCIEAPGGESGEIDLNFTHHVAPPVPPSFEALQAAAGEEEKDGQTPKTETFALSVDLKTRYESGVPRILTIEKSPAPPGHPEHGRWLVVALKVVSGAR